MALFVMVCWAPLGAGAAENPRPKEPAEERPPTELWSEFPLGESERAEAPSAPPTTTRQPLPLPPPASAQTRQDVDDEFDVQRFLLLMASAGGLLLALVLAFAGRQSTAPARAPASSRPRRPQRPPRQEPEPVRKAEPQPPRMDAVAAEQDERQRSRTELQSLQQEASGYLQVGTDELEARGARLEQLVAGVLEHNDRPAQTTAEPALPPPDVRAAPETLFFVPTEDGYSLVQHEGEVPEPGSIVQGAELGVDGSFYVARIGPSPLPSDSRRCAYLERA